MINRPVEIRTDDAGGAMRVNFGFCILDHARLYELNIRLLDIIPRYRYSIGSNFNAKIKIKFFVATKNPITRSFYTNVAE